MATCKSIKTPILSITSQQLGTNMEDNVADGHNKHNGHDGHRQQLFKSFYPPEITPLPLQIKQKLLSGKAPLSLFWIMMVSLKCSTLASHTIKVHFVLETFRFWIQDKCPESRTNSPPVSWIQNVIFRWIWYNKVLSIRLSLCLTENRKHIFCETCWAQWALLFCLSFFSLRGFV
jgi:hypothetical protein